VKSDVRIRHMVTGECRIRRDGRSFKSPAIHNFEPEIRILSRDARVAVLRQLDVLEFVELLSSTRDARVSRDMYSNPAIRPMSRTARDAQLTWHAQVAILRPPGILGFPPDIQLRGHVTSPILGRLRMVGLLEMLHRLGNLQWRYSGGSEYSRFWKRSTDSGCLSGNTRWARDARICQGAQLALHCTQE
jgi:hypothetical protein